MPGLVKAMGGADVANGRLDAFFDYDELLTDPQRVTREVWVNSAYSYYGRALQPAERARPALALRLLLDRAAVEDGRRRPRRATTLFTNGPPA